MLKWGDARTRLGKRKFSDARPEDNPVWVIDVFVDELDLRGLGFEGVVAETTGRPAYHPATVLKIYVYGYVNQIQSSRRLERETARNVEMMWLTGRLTPDFKTIADFRKDNGPAIRSACRQFVALCRSLNLFAHAMVAIDGSRFKAVNSRDRSFSRGSIERSPRPARCGDASPQNIHLEPSKRGWARPTSGCAPSKRSARR